MSRLSIQIEAENCNALASDLVSGVISPLSVSLYLRAILAENRDLGLGSLSRFALAYRLMKTDPGRYSARPILTYQSKTAGTVKPPIFDQSLLSFSGIVLVETDSAPDDEVLEIQRLESRLPFFSFVGGNVRSVACRSVRHNPTAEVVRGHWLYVDETDRALEQVGSQHLFAALALSHMPDKRKRHQCADALAVPHDIADHWVGQTRYLMPLGYRRLSREWQIRTDARLVKKKDGSLAQGLHAFGEAAHGVVRFLGVRNAINQKIWWRPESVGSSLFYGIKGEHE